MSTMQYFTSTLQIQSLQVTSLLRINTFIFIKAKLTTYSSPQHSLPCYHFKLKLKCRILLYTRMSLDTFKTNSMFHSYDTRNTSKLFITRHNTTLFEQILLTMVYLFTIHCLVKSKVLSQQLY